MNRRNGKSKSSKRAAGRFLSLRRQRDRCWTLICAEVVIAAQVMLLLPAPGHASGAAAPAPPPEPVNALSALIPVASQGQSPGRSQREERRPNREVPDVEPPPDYPSFSLEPTDEEIFRARVFREPLIPMEGEVNARENRALADALIAYLAGGDTEDFRPLRGFLNIYPESRWRASLLTNLGIVYVMTGFYSRAKAAFEEAWHLSKNSDDPDIKKVADLAITELMDLYMPIGDLANLERLLIEVEGREMEGSTNEKRLKAEGTVWGLKNAHDTAIPSGRAAIERLFAREKPNEPRHPQLDTLLPTMDGATLNEVEDLAGRVGLNLQRAYRQNKGQATVPVPSLAHFKGGHFTAVVEARNGRYRLDDPLLGGEIWMSREAFEEESTGYFLIAGGTLPPGWRKPAREEVDGVRGKCLVAQPDDGGTRAYDSRQCGLCGDGAAGMAAYSVHEVLVSLRITDNPVGHDPPVGPGIRFRATYNQREADQPQTFTYSNLGHQWTHDWLSFVEDNPSAVGDPVDLAVRGGGWERYKDFQNNVSAAELDSRAVMTITSTNPIEYERQLSDGSVEVYAQSDGAATAPRKVFLTEWSDPQGNTVTFTYDAQLRLVSVTDAIGQVTTLSYDMLENPLRITEVTDPFGRSAVFEYDENEKLLAITDVIGMTSEFRYGQSNFIRSMTTPYGTTTFRHGTGVYGQSVNKFLEATDPLGGTERVEFILPSTGVLPSADDPEDVPTGFSGKNNSLNSHFSVYFSKLAMDRDALGDPTKGVVTRWASTDTWTISTYHRHAKKMPLENRVWYWYDGNQESHQTGPLGRPSKIARVLDDGSSQIHRYEYNSRGKITRVTDPVGRETLNEYDTNQIDLLNVKQKNPESPSGYDLLTTYTYNSNHQPLTVTDAAGQTTTYTYNTEGQIATITTPERAGISEGRTTTYTYDEDGYPESIERPLDATMSYTYDSYGRIETVTDPDEYVLTYDYDDLDRVTKVTYPDSTFEEVAYERLDPARTRDRLGRWTHQVYDALQRMTAVTDPLGRTATQQWCSCGSLDALIDPNGNQTTWERDIQGRVIKEIRADGAEWVYGYEETTSRLKAVTDPKEQVVNYSYSLNDKLNGVTYTDEEHDTPNLTFSYDTAFNRLKAVVDGIGTTTYTYRPIETPPMLGAGRLLSVNGPLSNDVATYSYDERGRLVGREIGGVSLVRQYDALGRVIEESNPLGVFTYEYDGVTSRLSTITYPNGQTSTYAYYSNTSDRQLQEIHNKNPGGVTLSKFNYSYDPVGNINTWIQQQGTGSAKAYDLQHDRADQLRVAVWRTTDPTPTILKRYSYGYDLAGNRTVEQIDDTPFLSSYDNMNRVSSNSPGGMIRFAGLLSEAATVTIQGLPAVVSSHNSFEGRAEVDAGTSQVVVTATDYTGNERSNTYEVDVSGGTKTFTYDANGNVTGDGTRTFEWDAANRLAAVNQGVLRSEFSYDAFGRRVRIVEKNDSAVTSDYRFLWCGKEMCQERDDDGSTVLKMFFEHGMDVGGASRFFVADHLGSIREMTDVAGAVQARYEYDPYGNATKVVGSDDSPFTFSNHYVHVESGLVLTLYRPYNPILGRWMAEDPIGLEDGWNLYQYVRNSPVVLRDLYGLQAETLPDPWKPPSEMDPVYRYDGLCGKYMDLVCFRDDGPNRYTHRREWVDWKNEAIRQCEDKAPPGKSHTGRAYEIHLTNNEGRSRSFVYVCCEHDCPC